MSSRSLQFGLGIGLVMYPALRTLENIPKMGPYITLLTVIAGVILLLKGYVPK